MATKRKSPCNYGAKCYRRNPKHIRDFSHPDDSDSEPESPPKVVSPKKKSPEADHKKKSPETDHKKKSPATDPKKKSPETGEKKRPRTLDDYFGGRKKQKLDDEEVKASEDRADKTKESSATEEKTKESSATAASTGSSSGYKREVEVEAETGSDDAEDGGPTSPADVKQNIESKYMVQMPDDFYEFWDFASSINSKNPKDAFKKSIGLQLVGPFDILAGKTKRKNSAGKKPNYLIHWRYFYDPPEFLTIVRGDDHAQFHMGYFRDDPKEMPCFVASNAAKDNCTLAPRGENLFSAIGWYIDDKIKKEKDQKLKTLKSSLSEWANKKGFAMDLKTKDMKARDKKVVTKTFHGAGLVVPVDPVTEVGYREVPETPADLKRMFKKIVDSKSEEDRDKNFDPLMEIITLIQFANDECDYGEGVELGLDLFSYGAPVFHKTILNLLPLGYEFLGRQAYGKIIEAHLKNRKHSADLDQLA